MKLKKSQLKELIKQAIVEDLMDKEIKNPKTGNMIKVRTALQLPDEHPANKKAKGMVAKKPIKKDSGEFSIDKVMSKKIGKDTVGDILDNPKHPNYDKAEKYASQFNPDDEKVVSGGGPKVKGPKPGGEFSIDKVMDATIGKEKVSDLLGDEEHPDYEAALKYVMGFNPDDEKVISGAGEKAKKKAKDIDKQSMKAADDANAKMDAAEKAAKKKKKGKIKSNPFGESKVKRFTVKEVRMWMKKLEENRYKKVYNSDARRVAWMVNNEGVEISEMPKSMSKKWTKAQYGRERYLANEFIKSKSEQLSETKFYAFFNKKKHTIDGKSLYDAKQKAILKLKVPKSKVGMLSVVNAKEHEGGSFRFEQKLRQTIREIIKEQLNEVKFKKVILPNDMKTKVKVSKMIKQLKLKIDKDYDVKALKARGGDQVISILPKHYNKFIELAMKNKLNPRG